MSSGEIAFIVAVVATIMAVAVAATVKFFHEESLDPYQLKLEEMRDAGNCCVRCVHHEREVLEDGGDLID